jgi:hypothetical protein
VSVTVDDAKTGAAFDVLVPEDARALDVFHHPYAYAALRRQQSESSFTLTYHERTRRRQP